MDFGTTIAELNWWAVPVGAAIMFALGGLWYGALFARRWQRLAGLTDEEVRTGAARVFSAAAVASLVITGVLALFVGADAGVGIGAIAGLLAGVGWVAPAFAITFAFERRPAALTWIDAGYHAVAFTLVGTVLGTLA